MAVGARIQSAGWRYTAVVLIFLLLQTDFGVLALRRCHSLRRNNASSGVRIFFHCRVWYHKEPCATVFAYCERKNMYFCTKQLHENVSFDTRSLKSCCTLWMDSHLQYIREQMGIRTNGSLDRKMLANYSRTNGSSMARKV